ncbi:NAD(P)H-hydrate dehydratase [Tundrisphaera lichenicola]|uniref:NAD(P)H-hydrate dehydratase n=1 Tax=Tundrisphaera lichenicola TaxID=2029860 RepID=UPI003EBBB8E7
MPPIMAIERIEKLPRMKERAGDGHKGTYGTVLAFAGGRGSAGAAALVGGSALRSGAGLVRVLCPDEVQPTVASFEPSYMTYPVVSDPDGLASLGSSKRILDRFLPTASVLAMGPGMGQSPALRELLRWVLDTVTVPTVLDADALNNLAGQTEALSKLKRPVVLTPHPGEFARLTSRTTEEIQADRETHALALAETPNLIVVLKGEGTIVTDGTRLYVNTTGNPGMATGGSGDALTGVIAALIAQKMDPFDAACLGVYAHGLAGDIARDQNGVVGMIAGDIVDSLADAFHHLAP